MIRYLLHVAIALLLTGCKTAARIDPAYIIPTDGSMVKINKQLVVPGGQTRVFLQRGRVVPKAKFDRYYPSCNFEVWRLSQEATVIHSGSFVVSQVNRGTDLIVSLEPIRIAAVGWHPYDDDHAMIMHVVHMRLQSATQPNVYRLTCRGWLAIPADAEKPTIDDMREALGDFASIQLRGE